MTYYRKKPVIIEAVPVREALDAAGGDWEALPQWLRDAYESGDQGGIVFAPTRVLITTLEGNMVGEIDDWIIRGVQGELYPIKDEIFRQTYESVPPPAPEPDCKLCGDRGHYSVPQLYTCDHGTNPAAADLA